MTIKSRFSINVLENDKNEILLLKRGHDTDIGPGTWGFPAGHIEMDESPEECSLRELREELGDQFEFKLIKQLGPVRDTLYGGIYQVWLYHYRWLTGTINLNHEHTDYAWVCKEDFKNYDVTGGIDEDILYLNIWPRKYLNENRLP